MQPELFNIPIIDYPVKSYGVMLTLGFLLGVWLSMKRAERLKADPDLVLNIGFVCLLCGIVFSRLFYVIHYWDSSFKNQPNPLLAALNFTSGGLEYYGGLLGATVGAVVYMLIKRVSIRMYTDILTPGAALGLAFGRLGCLLNGCCWGGVCVDAQHNTVVPWGVQFPHGSPAQVRQWENRQLMLPAELIVTDPQYPVPFVLPRDLLEMPVEKRQGPDLKVRRLQREVRDLRALQGDKDKIRELERQLTEARSQLKRHNRQLRPLHRAMQFPSREDPSRGMSVSELRALADAHPSLPVHPAQVYGIINALLLSWLTVELLYRRKRHGVVVLTFFTLYPISRIILEMVRVDNPHDSAGLTISQLVSVVTAVCSLVGLLIVYRLPKRNPNIVPWYPPPAEDADGSEVAPVNSSI